MGPILIVAVGRVVPGELTALARRLHTLLRTPVSEAILDIDPKFAFDASRQQYRSDLLLELIAARAPTEGRVLGVVNHDLFIPVLTYVFGEAELGGRAAVVSTFRLRNELYGLEADAVLLHERLVKEAMHELGHTAGLLHCYTPGCVMQPSSHTDLVDVKSEMFCRNCALQVGLEPLPRSPVL